MEKKTVGIVIFIIGIMLFPVAFAVSGFIFWLPDGDLIRMIAMLVSNITLFVGIPVTIIGLSIFLYYRSREK